MCFFVLEGVKHWQTMGWEHLMERSSVWLPHWVQTSSKSSFSFSFRRSVARNRFFCSKDWGPKAVDISMLDNRCSWSLLVETVLSPVGDEWCLPGADLQIQFCSRASDVQSCGGLFSPPHHSLPALGKFANSILSFWIQSCIMKLGMILYSWTPLYSVSLAWQKKLWKELVNILNELTTLAILSQ